MAQLHKLAAVGLTLTLSSVSSAFALGLGEVTWKSNLNQTLDAEIAVYDAKNVSNKELVVKIASDEEFAKAGINKPFILSNLIFTPMIKSNGKGIIKITSREPIKEPYLDFLVHVTWGTGQTLREYTLLIDPPAYESSTVVAPVAAKLPVAKTNTVKKNTRPVAKAPSRAPTPTTAKAQEGTVRAHRGSSLWLLAERSRVRGVSVQQAMLAIYEANPEAFIDGKMSLLKEGAILRVPKVDEMRKTSSLAAQEQVLANVNGTVQAKPRQVIASKTEQQAPSDKDVKDELKLSGVSDKRSSSNGVTANLENSLTQTAEELDATRRNNEDLKDRVKSLESSLADMKKIVELKNNQLAALQQNIKGQLAEEGQETPTAPLSNEPSDKATLIQDQQSPVSTEMQHQAQNEAKVVDSTQPDQAKTDSKVDVSTSVVEQSTEAQGQVKQGKAAN